MSSPVEYLGNALEGILSRRIPNLQLEQLLLELDKKRAKFDADSDLMICHKLIIR